MLFVLTRCTVWANTFCKLTIQILSMPSAQKPVLDEIGSSETWKWTGQHYCCQIFEEWFEEMLTKRSQSVFRMLYAFGTKPLLAEKLEARKHKDGIANIYCCENFEEWFEEMLTKRSQNVFQVLHVFGTETSSRPNWKLGSMKMKWSAFIVAKILKNDLN